MLKVVLNTSEHKSCFKLYYEMPRLAAIEQGIVCGTDVCRGKPDKKSIMLYIMCLFQVLPHSDIDMANANIPSGTAVNVHVVSARVFPQPTMSQFLY
jgi:hypothetical protein